ncbi:hypothetical protein EMCRGX_G014149 [Ephydatia muelleri]
MPGMEFCDLKLHPSGGEAYGIAYITFNSIPAAVPLNTRLRRNSIGAEFDGRVFFICNPQPPADHLLREIFARFGTLTDIWVVRGKNYGYAKFTTRVSAEAAITALHGMEVFGVKLKVMLADPPPEDGRSKRLCS